MTDSNPSSAIGSDPADPDGGGNDQKLLTITEAAAIVRAPVATLRYWRWPDPDP